jgi:hypothetical protein
MVDILTTHLTVRGRPMLAAFVNKGKSYRKVRSLDVSHQILKARRIAGINLIILLCVGEIQDDAKNDLIQSAIDANADYLVIDAMDVARLFVVHHIVCEVDGMPIQDGRCLRCGKSVDEPLRLTFDVFEKPQYSLLNTSEISLGTKRYRADVVTDRHYSKPVLREVIRDATWELRTSNYYRSERTKQRFGEQQADIVFLFVYLDSQDRQTFNWICRTHWINPQLPESLRPKLWQAEETLDDIAIDWNGQYESRRGLHDRYSKMEWVQHVEPLIPSADEVVQRATDLFRQRENGSLTQEAFEASMVTLQEIMASIYQQSRSTKIPPLECNDANWAFQAMITSAHNIFVPYAPWARNRGAWNHQRWHVRTYLDYYSKDFGKFQFEWEKVR